jgi:hypothetical protein
MNEKRKAKHGLKSISIKNQLIEYCFLITLFYFIAR